MPFRFAANLTRFFSELPFCDRFQAAKNAGFAAVEITTPLQDLGYSAEQISQAKLKAGVDVVLINGCSGSILKGEFGLAALPHRKDDFAKDLCLAIQYAKALNCKCMHIMAGTKSANIEDAAMEECYLENIRSAANALQAEGIVVNIEFICPQTVPAYFVSSGKQALDYIKKLDHPNVKLQMDIFHLQMTEGNLTEAIERYLPYTSYVQVSQAPNRDEPSAEGEVNYLYVLQLLQSLGYTGYVGLEYTPQRDTVSSLSWMKKWPLTGTVPRALANNLWTDCVISGFLVDIFGVLVESGSEGIGLAIPGSVAAVRKLKASGYPIRFVSNETTCTRQSLIDQLQQLSFDINLEDVFTPAPAICAILQERGLRPFLLVTAEAEADYAHVDKTKPNCVVLGDARLRFSEDNMNAAFQLLMSLEKPVIFSLGMGRYYQHDGKVRLDVGTYVKSLEYATGTDAEVVGKPAPAYFNAALKDMNLAPGNVVMIGDDIESDVGGAQACGMFGVQVRTGKYRPEYDNHPTVKPHDIVDNLAQAVDKFLG